MAGLCVPRELGDAGPGFCQANGCFAACYGRTKTRWEILRELEVWAKAQVVACSLLTPSRSSSSEFPHGCRSLVVRRVTRADESHTPSVPFCEESFSPGLLPNFCGSAVHLFPCRRSLLCSAAEPPEAAALFLSARHDLHILQGQ